MPVAYLPGPASGQWQVGPVVVHGYALCVALGIAVALWVAERRYRASGGRRWQILDIATLAVPAGLVGARLYRVIVDYGRYFGHGRDWVDILRVWDGGFGLPGAAAGGLVAAWLVCRSRELRLGPVLSAAAPGLAFGQAIGVLGNWFSQGLYGPPSAEPWAVPISPWNRVPGYQNFATFQPLFLYEAIWDACVGVALIYLIRRLSLTGDRALVLCAGLYAVGRLGSAWFSLSGPLQRSGVLVQEIAALGAVAVVAGYLYLTRSRRGPEPLTTGPPRRLVLRSAPPAARPEDVTSGSNASRMAGDVPGSAD
jgi:prolipoprotein diacylglyceryl transferase